MITKQQYEKSLLVVREYHKQIKNQLDDVELALEDLGLHTTGDDLIRDVLTFKQAKALEMANDWKLWNKDVLIKDIKAVNVAPIRYYRNIGEKTVSAIKEKLSSLGVKVYDKKANTLDKTQELPVVIFKDPSRYEN